MVDHQRAGRYPPPICTRETSPTDFWRPSRTRRSSCCTERGRLGRARSPARSPPVPIRRGTSRSTMPLSWPRLPRIPRASSGHWRIQWCWTRSSGHRACFSPSSRRSTRTGGRAASEQVDYRDNLRLVAVPPAYRGLRCVTTRDSVGETPQEIAFSLKTPSRVVVLFDEQVGRRPKWLAPRRHVRLLFVETRGERTDAGSPTGLFKEAKMGALI